MKTKKSFVLFIVSCLSLLLASMLGVAAEDTADKGMHTFTLVSLIVAGVVILAVTVICIIKRQKVAESVRAYKSEMKKITWYPWKQVWRNTVLVIVIVLVTAAVIGLLDLFFFESQYLLTGKGLKLPW